MTCYPLSPTDPICGFLGGVSSIFAPGTATGSASAVIPQFTGPEAFFCPAIPISQLQMVYCLGAMAVTAVQGCLAMKAVFVGTKDICQGLPTTNCVSNPGPAAPPVATAAPGIKTSTTAAAKPTLTDAPQATAGSSGSGSGSSGGSGGGTGSGSGSGSGAADIGSSSNSNGGGVIVVGPSNPGTSPNIITPTLDTPTGLADGNSTCPVCADCRKAGCSNFGQCGGTGTCQCPLGFGGPDCSEPLCNSPMVLNAARMIRPTTSPCTCDNGFSGPNCNVCQTDQACQAGGSSLNAVSSNVCNKSPEAWVAQSAVCVTDVYNGTSTITLFRNITSGVAFGTLWYNNVEQFICQMHNCSQVLSHSDPFQYQYLCSNTQCLCSRAAIFCGGPGVTVDLTKQIAQASGPFSFKCESINSTVCTISFDFLKTLFPDGMSLPACMFGECADPSSNPFLAFLSTQPKPLSPLEISSIAFVTAIVSVILAGLLWAFFKQSKARKAHTPAPLTGLTLSFSDIEYSLTSPVSKQILHKVSGVAPAGQVLAVMGPSGAGKSSFLDIIAGKTKVGVTSGVIKLDGVPVDAARLRSLVGYVDQEDLQMSTMTVRETLMFSAALRLPESMHWSMKEKIVEEVLDSLGLTHVSDTRVGGFGQRGISGGEMRRVSIGIELVTSPAVILLDEPTSGLDSHSAHLLIQNLAQLAHKQGKTVIFTIHQPRSDIFSLFDQLVILSRGQPLYCGPGNDEVAKYFQSIGQPCPEDYAMADHMLDVAADVELSANIVKNARIDRTEAVASAEQHAALLERMKQFGEVKVGFMTQLVVLMVRSGKNLVRTPSLLLAHLVMAVIMGLFIGGAYFLSGVTLLGVQNRMGSVLFILSLIGFSSLSAIGSFSKEKNLFMRERSNGMYGPFPYFVSKILFDIIPLRLIPTSIIGGITFFMIGYTNAPGSFAKFITLLLVFSAEMGLLCLCLGIAIAQVGTATLAGAILILFKMLFAGLLINSSSLPAALSWIQYLSFFKYPYEGLVVNDLATVNIVDEFDRAEINMPATLIIEKFGLNINNYTCDFLVSVGILIVLLVLIAGLIQFRLKERR
ncbi:hypothetical protein HDU98_009057 [Podochytrium sp. JEL0797]|nr:hypothetical protein HDU98_009057 [Podochytrium sp. JEL0797]